MRLSAMLILAAALAACSSGPRGPSRAVIDRALSTAPGAAQPSTLVATELAYARAAQEQGQFTAAGRYAGPGAVLHGRNGTVLAAPLIESLRDPEQAMSWAPRTIVMSCDGALAASLGRFRDAGGTVGNYVTIWRRQPDGEYRWIYDVAGPDVPQPPPRKEIEDGDIVVVAIDAVQGLIADCPRRGETVPAPPAIAIGEDGKQGGTLSRDGTLRWRWEHRDDGTKYVAVDYFYQGGWQTAVEEGLTSPPEG